MDGQNFQLVPAEDARKTPARTNAAASPFNFRAQSEGNKGEPGGSILSSARSWLRAAVFDTGPR
jgi:hypothetical protein